MPIPTLLLVLLPALFSDPPEWGGFRGNNGAGVADSERLLDALDPEVNLVWRTEVPGGYSSPTVAGERVFVTGAEGEALLTICLDRHTGEIRWRRAVPFDGERPGKNSPAAPSPVTDGERVYALFHGFGLIAFDLEGKELWTKPLGPFHIPHGMSSSPLVHGDLLILQVDQDQDSHLIAFEASTGEEVWRTDRPGARHSYATPALYVPTEGPAQVIVSGSFQISGYSALTGEKLWWMDGSAWQTKSVPVIAGDTCIVNAYMVTPSEFGVPSMARPWAEVLEERDADGDGKIARSEWDDRMLQKAWFLFDLDDDDHLDEQDYAYAAACADATGGLFAIRLDGRGDVTESHVTWKYDDRRGLPDAPSPLLFEGTLFMIKEGGLFTAIDPATGEVAKQGRVGEPDQYFASPIGGAGRIITASQSGQLCVIAGGREWEVLSVNDLEEDVWATPAIAGDQVFVRSVEALYCFQDDSER